MLELAQRNSHAEILPALAKFQKEKRYGINGRFCLGRVRGRAVDFVTVVIVAVRLVMAAIDKLSGLVVVFPLAVMVVARPARYNSEVPSAALPIFVDIAAIPSAFVVQAACIPASVIQLVIEPMDNFAPVFAAAFALMAMCCRNGLCHFAADYFGVRLHFGAADSVAVASQQDTNSGFQHFGCDCYFHFRLEVEPLFGSVKHFYFEREIHFARADLNFDFHSAATPASAVQWSAMESYEACQNFRFVWRRHARSAAG